MGFAIHLVFSLHFARLLTGGFPLALGFPFFFGAGLDRYPPCVGAILDLSVGLVAGSSSCPGNAPSSPSLGNGVDSRASLGSSSGSGISGPPVASATSIPGSILDEPPNSTNKYLELDELGSTNKVKQMKAMVMEIFGIIVKIKMIIILKNKTSD